MAEWKEIASAPKDGTQVLIYDRAWCGGKPMIHVSRWQKYQLVSVGGPLRGVTERGAWEGVTEATHWMPLPDPPKDAK
jgi:hypothetical protein